MTDLVTLSRWLIDSPDYEVAARKGVTASRSEFKHEVNGWLNILASRNGQRWAVYHEDAMVFAAILFALWQLGRTACIPGDNRPGNVQRLQTFVDGLVGDFDSDAVVTADPASQPTETKFDWKVVDPQLVGLEVFTSGSTGEPEAIAKTIQQLELEVETLQALWPEQGGDAVLATVSHQHMYGLTFRLFWPLCSARAFERDIIEYTEDITHLGCHYRYFSLVSSPSHLARMNASADWNKIKGRCRYAVSSAALLQRSDSLTAGEFLAAPVREIYGSSETGAIAWRIQQQSAEDALWQPLPKLELSADESGHLIVNAPYLLIKNYRLSDRVTFSNTNTFKLLGRSDRIVKVEGKRISLSAIEKHLMTHGWVKSARALTIQRRRVESAVVVELGAAGLQVLADRGTKFLIEKFRALLCRYLEPVALPRRWRFVAQMPFNSQGKIPLQALQQMFESKTKVDWPDTSMLDLQETELTMRCLIPPELIYFEGHFPNNPILPGIVQVHWAEAYGRQHLAIEGVFDRLEVIKFQQVIAPAATVDLTLRYDARKAKLHFCYESERGPHSSGRICFRV